MNGDGHQAQNAGRVASALNLGGQGCSGVGGPREPQLTTCLKMTSPAGTKCGFSVTDSEILC